MDEQLAALTGRYMRIDCSCFRGGAVGHSGPEGARLKHHACLEAQGGELRSISQTLTRRNIP